MKKYKITYGVIAAHLIFIALFAKWSKNVALHHSKPIAVHSYTIAPTKPKPSKQLARTSQKKPKPKPPKRKKAHDVMKDLQKSIAKIEKTKEPNDEKKVTAPAKPKTKVVYSTLLAQTLKSALHLPEEGDVKLSLRIKNSGEVIDIKMLSSQSVSNSMYLEEEIPKIRFPIFKAELLGKKEHTFTLTFCHDD